MDTTSGVRWSSVVVGKFGDMCQICTLLVGVLLIMTSQEVSSQDSVPKTNVSAPEQMTATLYCNVDNKEAATYKSWSKNNIVLFTDDKPVSSSSSRLSVQSADYSLVIQNLVKTDAGLYRCQISFASGDPQLRDTQLIVQVAPGEPTISFNKIGNLREDDTVEISCSSSGGIPPPEMRMYRNNVQMKGITTDSGSTRTYTVERTLTWEDNTAVFRCTVYNVVNSNNPKTTTTTRPVLYAPRLSIAPYNPLVILKGGSGTATCVVNANPPVEKQNIHWKKDGVNQEGGGANLTFSGIQEVEAGTYVCEATNAVATRDTSVEVKVQYEPVVTVVPALNTFREDAEITVTCNYQANPPPAADQIVWRKQGSAQTWTGRSLYFAKAERGHNGTYTCTVTNNLQLSGQSARDGVGNASAEIIVQYAPGRASITGSVEIPKGERIDYTCSSQEPGVPQASYKWRKQGSSQIIGNGPTFAIVSTSLTDEGVYECIPYNVVGEGPAASISLTILERPEWQTELAGETHAKVGDKGFSLTCSVRAKPEAEVTWQKNGRPIDDRFYEIQTSTAPVSPNSFIVTSRLLFTGTKRQDLGLAIDAIITQDVGNYSCQASNRFGVITSTGKLIINYRPVIDSSIARVAVDMNETATINCYAHALPKPTFQWFFNSKQLTHDGKTFLISTMTDTGRAGYPYGSQLIVEKVNSQHLGVYRCESSNNVGTTTQNVSLTWKSVPDVPTNIQAIETTWESIKLQWKPGFDGGYPQTFYISHNDETMAVPGTTSLKVLDGLHPNTTYRISMYANNALGQSPVTQVIQVRTKVLAFPALKDVKYHVTRQTVTFVAPHGAAYCLRVDVSRNNGQTWENYAECVVPSEGSIKLDSNQFNQVNLTLCLSNRPAICNRSPVRASKVEQVEDIPTSTIIIVACVCGAVILILGIIFIVLCIRRRRPEKEYPERPHMRPNSLPANARGHKNGGVGLDNPGLDSMDHGDRDPIFTTNNSPYGNGHANGVPYEMNEFSYGREYGQPGDFNSIDKKNLKNLPNVNIPYGDQKLDDSSGSHPESGYSTPDPTKPKKVIYEVVV